MKYISLSWPLIIVTSIVLYALTILFLPFNSQTASLFLFALIAYWSRLPGVGIPNPYYIIYSMDLVDIFTLLIAVHVSPIHAIIFTCFCNLWSRAAGVFPDWGGPMQDAIIQSVIALLTPFIYVLVGGNLTLLVSVYTILRIIGFFLIWFIWPRYTFIQRLITSIINGIIVFSINAFYARLFGNFFENILREGAKFNIALFVIATLIILGIYVIINGLDSITPKRILRKLIHKINQK